MKHLKKEKNEKAFTVLALTLISGTLLGDAIDCRGKISRVLVYKDGSVNVVTSWRGDYTIICNLKEEREGVSVAVMRQIL